MTEPVVIYDADAEQLAVGQATLDGDRVVVLVPRLQREIGVGMVVQLHFSKSTRKAVLVSYRGNEIVFELVGPAQ